MKKNFTILCCLQISVALAQNKDSAALKDFVVASNIGITRVHNQYFSFDSSYELIKDTSAELIKPLATYYHSSTIYDESKIILIDNKTFFCFYVGCMNRVCSAGYYEKNGNRIILNSNKEVINQLKDKILDDLLSLSFVPLTNQKLKIDDEKLIPMSNSSSFY